MCQQLVWFPLRRPAYTLEPERGAETGGWSSERATLGEARPRVLSKCYSDRDVGLMLLLFRPPSRTVWLWIAGMTISLGLFAAPVPAQPIVIAAPPRTASPVESPAKEPSPVAGLITESPGLDLPVADNSSTLQLRATWGGGRQALWRGRISVERGKILASRSLSLEPDAPVAQRLENDELVIEPLVPRSFDGVDLTLQAGADAELVIELSDESGSSAEPNRIPIRELFVRPQGWRLGEGDERFVIERAPGDDVRVMFRRDNLIFAPREVFEFTVNPGPILASEELASLVAEVKVLRSRSEELVDSARGAPLSSISNESGANQFRLTMPDAPGPYSLRIELVTRRGVSPFLRTRTLLSRTIDVIVVGTDSEPRSKEGTGLSGVPGLAAIGAQLPAPLRILPGTRSETQRDWATLHEIDPENPSWIERLQQWDAVNLVKRFASETLGSGNVTIEESPAGPVLRIPPGAWRAFPLPVDRRGDPHRLDIEYVAADLSSAMPHRAAVSFIEPDSLSWSNAVPAGVGLELRRVSGVSAPAADVTEVVAVYHWPKTRSPYVLVANLSKSQDLRIRRLRWSGGPSHLEPLTDSREALAVSTDSSAEPAAVPRRFVGPHLTPASLADLGFSERLIERDQGLPIEDWKYYDDAISRLIERMKASGMNAITLQVAGGGGGWYPSSTMRFGPRYDRGVFSIEGRDPIPKDVVELFLARFDAANLSVIPVFDFDAPFAEIESLRRGGAGREVDQVDEHGESRRRRAIEARDPRGYHDPLHPEVSAVLIDRVVEFMERYRDHSSLAGIGLRLGPGSHLFFGEPGWGASSNRIREFLQSRDSAVTAGPQETAALLRGETRDAWLVWRGAAVAELLGRIESRALGVESRRRLFLLGEDWYQGVSVTRKTQVVPRGRDPDSVAAALEAGVSLEAIQQSTRAVLLHGSTVVWNDTPGRRRVERALGANPLQQRGGNSSRIGLVTHRPPAPITIESLGQWIPLRGEGMASEIQPRAVAVGDLARKREAEALAAGDCWALVDEGWGLPVVASERDLAFRQIYAQLPQVLFENEGRELLANAVVPVVMRRGIGAADDLRYVVNPSPWPVKVEIKLRENGSDQAIVPLSVSRVMVRRGGAGTTVTLELDPYGLAAFRSQDRASSVTDIKVSMTEEVTPILQSELDRWLATVNELGVERAETLPLMNAGFERTMPTDLPEDWLRSREGVSAPQVEGALEGTRVARMMSEADVVWMRSGELPVPRSGRLSLQVRVRNRMADRQPNLRLAIEAMTPMGPYYQFAPIGDPQTCGPGREIGKDWTPFAVHFDDLPPEQVSELRIGFDLMNAGDVEIDQIVVLDGWLDDADQKVLFQRTSVARMRLQEGGVYGPYELLEGYWPRAILETEAVVSVPLEMPPAAAAPADVAEPTQQSRNPWDRVLQLVPNQRVLR